MAKEKFVLVSLKEEKAKELAQVISNDSCRRILDYLAEKEDATETQIAASLGLPISTIHYNLRHLIKAGIISAEEFHYSKKGREVNHYRLANKYIIIAPKTTHGIKEKLRTILPVSLLALAGAGFIHMYTKYFLAKKGFVSRAMPSVMEAAVSDAPEMEQVFGKAAEEGARAVMEKAPQVAAEAARASPNYALWFLSGCVFVIILMVVLELMRKKR
ncbi:helix-turn-helix domain-containing protein [Candidatus Woesearchaeota archaeon]|nr:helix-turn-helix domain-containing protein [Candidatus Woesearchaeota archaeon]